MSHHWEFIAPAALAGFGAVVYLAHRLRHPRGGHRADPAGIDDGMCKERSCPNFGGVWHGCPQFQDVRDQALPVAKVEGSPPWAPADPAERGPGSLGTWFPHDGWARYGPDGYALDWAARNELLPPEATLRRELHHVDLLLPGEEGAVLDEIPGSGPTARGAGDESEGSGLTAPPAPTPIGLAYERADAFMAIMRADHERWMSLARERWAAA